MSESLQSVVKNLSLNRVNVVDELYNELQSNEKAFFKIYEAYIHIKNSPMNTTEIQISVLSNLYYVNFEFFLFSIIPKLSKLEILWRIKKMLK